MTVTQRPRTDVRPSGVMVGLVNIFFPALIFWLTVITVCIVLGVVWYLAATVVALLGLLLVAVGVDALVEWGWRR